MNTALIRAAHIEPTIAVTILTALLGLAFGLTPARLALLTAAMFAGQLVVGWSNDLIDAGRDTTVLRADKPLATGEVTRTAVTAAMGVAAAAAVGISATLGWRCAAAHLVLVVGSGLAYNLGLKATRWSWLPYVVAFGSLPVVVSLAAVPPVGPAAWLVAASGTLGAAAHFLNTLPDLDDDAATGIKGLPHRMGRSRSQATAVILLVSASALTVLGPPGPAPALSWAGLLLAAALAVGAFTARGRMPFRYGVAIAAVNVTMVVLAAGR